MGSKSIKRCPNTFGSNKECTDAHLATVLPPILETMEWGPNELILDHGCADGGTCSKYFAPRAEKSNSIIYALDNCGFMINHCKEKFSHPNVKYVHGNLAKDDSPVKDLKFNKIFSLYTLHYIQDYKRELKLLSDHLAPGGEMYMLIVLESHMFEMLKQIRTLKMWDAHDAKGHLVIPNWLNQDKETSKVLKADFLALGLEIKQFSPEEVVHKYCAWKAKKTKNFPYNLQ